MKKLLSIAAIAALAFSTVSCEDFLEQFQNDPEEQNQNGNENGNENGNGNEEQKEKDPAKVTVQLVCEGANFAVAGITVSLSDAEATFNVDAVTAENGAAEFTLKEGTYTASATYTTSADGVRIAYSGVNNAIAVKADDTEVAATIDLQKVESKQIVIKEVYSTGCPKDPSGSYSDDAYIILYNNSELEADATDVVFGMLFPYNGHATNKYLSDGGLIYENEGWIPAASALWSFTSEVKIPAYSQIVVVLYGAIDHTATQPASVNLSDASYYWMSKNDQFKAAKYNVSDAIPESNYLSCIPFNTGTAWLFSNTAPALFIGNMPKAEAETLASNTEGYDTTQGTGGAQVAVKFPVDKVIGCVDIFAADKLDTSNGRFPASLNTGYVAITSKLGHTVYRNVDKEATEALPENKDKLVYEYALGTYDAATGAGSTDPSGIDAEASIANGAHIIYVQTNNSGNDFHERSVSSLKK